MKLEDFEKLPEEFKQKALKTIQDPRLRAKGCWDPDGDMITLEIDPDGDLQINECCMIGGDHIDDFFQALGEILKYRSQQSDK